MSVVVHASRMKTRMAFVTMKTTALVSWMLAVSATAPVTSTNVVVQTSQLATAIVMATSSMLWVYAAATAVQMLMAMA